MAVDRPGNVYASDAGSRRILKIGAQGGAAWLAGQDSSAYDPAAGKLQDGSGETASFGYIQGIALDSADYLWVADCDNRRVRRVSPTEEVETVAGSGPTGAPFPGSAITCIDGPAAQAMFAAPCDVAVLADGTVCIADSLGRRIRRLTPQGVVTTWAGNGVDAVVDGVGTQASFHCPQRLAVDQQGNAYVWDTDRSIRKVASDGTVSTLFTGNYTAVAVSPAGQLFVSDPYRIYRVDASGSLQYFTGPRLAAPTPTPSPAANSQKHV